MDLDKIISKTNVTMHPEYRQDYKNINGYTIFSFYRLDIDPKWKLSKEIVATTTFQKYFYLFSLLIGKNAQESYLDKLNYKLIKPKENELPYLIENELKQVNGQKKEKPKDVLQENFKEVEREYDESSHNHPRENLAIRLNNLAGSEEVDALTFYFKDEFNAETRYDRQNKTLNLEIDRKDARKLIKMIENKKYDNGPKPYLETIVEIKGY